MVKFFDIFPSKLAKESNIVSEYDLVLVNVTFWGMITGDLLTGDISKITDNYSKKRPIVVYEIDKKRASYFAISTNENVYRRFKIVFDYSKCPRISGCKALNFHKKGYIFFLKKTVQRRGVKIDVKSKFNFDINRLMKHLVDCSRIKKLLGKSATFSDVFYVCGNCDKTYIKNVVQRIDL